MFHSLFLPTLDFVLILNHHSPESHHGIASVVVDVLTIIVMGVADPCILHAAGTSPTKAEGGQGHGVGTGVEQTPSTEFFFYQSADGQCVFLHPLVLRALLAHYGSYATCPPQVRSYLLNGTTTNSISVLCLINACRQSKPDTQLQVIGEGQDILWHMSTGGCYITAS